MPTRALARWLARLCGGKMVNRGKSSLEELVAHAEKEGLARIVFVYESHGNPSALAFYDCQDGWMDAEFRISSQTLPPRFSPGGERKRVPKGAVLKVTGQGKQQDKLRELLETPEQTDVEEEREAVDLHFENGKIWFEIDGTTIGPIIRGEIRVEEEKKKETDEEKEKGGET